MHGQNHFKFILKDIRNPVQPVPSQHDARIRSATKNGKPFKVHELGHERFWDLKELAGTCGGVCSHPAYSTAVYRE